MNAKKFCNEIFLLLQVLANRGSDSSLAGEASFQGLI